MYRIFQACFRRQSSSATSSDEACDDLSDPLRFIMLRYCPHSVTVYHWGNIIKADIGVYCTYSTVTEWEQYPNQSTSSVNPKPQRRIPYSPLLKRTVV